MTIEVKAAVSNAFAGNAPYLHTAASNCPSLREKQVTMHALRHTCAIRLLHAGIDTSVIALWLGHASPATTQIDLDADLELKQQARPHHPALQQTRQLPATRRTTWVPPRL